MTISLLYPASQAAKARQPLPFYEYAAATAFSYGQHGECPCFVGAGSVQTICIAATFLLYQQILKYVKQVSNDKNTTCAYYNK